MGEVNQKFERFKHGLTKLTPRAKRKLLEALEPGQSPRQSLERMYAGEEITAEEKEQLLTALEVHSDVHIKGVREFRYLFVQEDPFQADQARHGPSSERRGGRKPGLDDYDAQVNRENQPDKYTFGRFNRH